MEPRCIKAGDRCSTAADSGVSGVNQRPVVMRALMGKDVSRGVPRGKAEEEKEHGGDGHKSIVCKDYFRGACKRGLDCWFEHPGAKKESPNL